MQFFRTTNAVVIVLVGVLVLASTPDIVGLVLTPVGTSSGTTPVQPFLGGLSDKSLGVQRYLASIGYRRPGDWSGWLTNAAIAAADCDTNYCLRYQLAAVCYAAAASALRTPGHTAVAEAIMRDAIERMIDVRSWRYVESVFGPASPDYPDPVAYKNIMYSGHLAQMVTLYEAISGDDHYARRGWDFVWNASYRVHYTTDSLLAAVLANSRRQWSRAAAKFAAAGVPCEPDSVFVICNNFPQNAYVLWDAAAAEHDVATAWQAAVVDYASGASDVSPDFFRLSFLLPVGQWDPVSSVGSDAWALAWQRPWWNESAATANSSCLLRAAYLHMNVSAQWRRSAAGDQWWLDPGAAQSAFPFDRYVTSSYWPVIARQFTGGSSSLDQQCGGPFASPDVRAPGVVDWLEHTTAALVSTGRPPNDLGYAYATPDGLYSNIVTANMLLAAALPDNQPDFLRNAFRALGQRQWRQPHWPLVRSVPFNDLVVPAAYYDPNAAVLSFSLLAALSPAAANQTLPANAADVLVANVPASGIVKVVLNGQPFDRFAPAPALCSTCWLLRVLVPPAAAAQPDRYSVIFSD